MFKRLYTIFFFTSLLTAASMQAEEQLSAQEYYAKMTSSFQSQSWSNLAKYSQILVTQFAKTPFEEEAWYYLGVAYYYLGDYDFANRKLSYYLKNSPSPKFFEEALFYKFQVAENFRQGAKKHIFAWKASPQWLPAKDEAMQIYDEVINTFPFHELAARSLFGKSLVQFDFEEYRPSIETLQLLIRRFPKHELAIESYLQIAKTYLFQSQIQQDPDLLDSAEVNLRRFKQSFPGEERWQEAKVILDGMKEVYASSLYEIGCFYERTKKPQAALIYHKKVAAKFPETKSAAEARKRIASLEKE